MTDQDNLRDRIEEILHQVGNGELALNISPNERNELAQAIIDELGLTMETYVGYESILGVENG